MAAFNEKPEFTDGFINGGFFVFEPGVLEGYLDDRDDLSLEQEPLQRLAADGELMMWPHRGFWQPMDTFREWKILEQLWSSGQAPWKVWREHETSKLLARTGRTGHRLHGFARQLADADCC